VKTAQGKQRTATLGRLGGPLDQLGDDVLVARARRGDGDAFAELYRRHASATRTTVAEHVRDRDRQLDLVQETFTRAWSSLHQLRDARAFRPWAFQIARNVAMDDIRQCRRTRAESIEDHEPESTVDADPGAATELRALADRLRAGFSSLSSRDARALAMAIDSECGPDEIARELGISHGNAKVVLHRARRRLRSCLAVEAVGA